MCKSVYARVMHRKCCDSMQLMEEPKVLEKKITTPGMEVVK